MIVQMATLKNESRVSETVATVSCACAGVLFPTRIALGTLPRTLERL